MDIKTLQSFDWRALQKYTSPQAFDDLNRFLENLPVNAGQTILVIAGIVWCAAGGLGLFATVHLQKMTELRAELQEAEALQPIVPVLKDVRINPKEVEEFVEKSKEIYRNIDIKAQGSAILLSAEQTSSFGQFREAVGHVQNGGAGWKVSVDRLCVGRECERHPLAAALKINKVSVERPG